MDLILKRGEILLKCLVPRAGGWPRVVVAGPKLGPHLTERKLKREFTCIISDVPSNSPVLYVASLECSRDTSACHVPGPREQQDGPCKQELNAHSILGATLRAGQGHCSLSEWQQACRDGIKANFHQNFLYSLPLGSACWRCPILTPPLKSLVFSSPARSQFLLATCFYLLTIVACLPLSLPVSATSDSIAHQCEIWISQPLQASAAPTFILLPWRHHWLSEASGLKSPLLYSPSLPTGDTALPNPLPVELFKGPLAWGAWVAQLNLHLLISAQFMILGRWF